MTTGPRKPSGSIAHIRDQANAIAMRAVSDSAKTGLRALSPNAKDQRLVDCLDELVNLISAGISPTEAATLAATATYSTNLYHHALLAYENSMDEFLTAIGEVPTRQRSKPKIIDVALRRLRNRGHPLVSILVEQAQATVPTLRASASGKKGKQTSQAVKAYAIKLFTARDWNNISVSAVRHRLWPQVRAEAARLKWVVSDERGLINLYKWLLEYNKQYPAN